MSKVKYEAVFGPQELFNNELEPNAIAVIFSDRANKLHATSEAEIDRQLQRTGSYVVAMRRIIKTPVWTVADQKAGRFPEVGCKCVGILSEDIKRVVHVNKHLVAVENEKTLNVCNFTHEEFFRNHKSIETPAEKAARLREEWKNNVIEIHHGKRRKMSTSTFLLDDIYDALLTGELKAPKGGE